MLLAEVLPEFEYSVAKSVKCSDRSVDASVSAASKSFCAIRSNCDTEYTGGGSVDGS